MKREARREVSYSKKYKDIVAYQVVSDGISIIKICSKYGIEEPYKVREWVREYMRKRGMIRRPRSLIRRGKEPFALITEPVNRQFSRYEEIIMYQECLIEAFYSEANEEQKKKLLERLSPRQRRNLKATGKLST